VADYMFVDADNHYYEAEDAFIRHGDEGLRVCTNSMSAPAL
jgi:hypothetical protein